MPLADHRGLISGPLEKLGKRWLATVEGVAVVAQSIQVAVFAGQHDGAARGTDRVGDETVVEPDSVGGDAIDVRSLDQLTAVGADCCDGVIVRHDEEDVRRLPFRGRRIGAWRLRLRTRERARCQESERPSGHRL